MAASSGGFRREPIEEIKTRQIKTEANFFATKLFGTVVKVFWYSGEETA